MKPKDIHEQLMPPFKTPEGYSFETLRQLQNEKDIVQLKESHRVIESYSQSELLQVMSVLNMSFEQNWDKKKLIQSYYNQFYSPRFLKWLISFVDPRINQLFIYDSFIAREDVSPKVWREIYPMLEVLSQTGIIDSQKVQDDHMIFKARPAYSEILFILAEQPPFRHANEFNVLLINLMNQMLTVFGIMEESEVENYLVNFELTTHEQAAKILQLIRTTPLLFTAFGYVDHLFVLKRFNSPEKRQALLDQQKQFKRYQIKNIQEGLQIANHVFLRVPSSRLLKDLKEIMKKSTSEVPKGLEEHLIHQVLNFPIPSVEPLFDLVNQFVPLNESDKQTLEADLKILVRHKHLPEFNGQSVEQLMKQQKGQKEKEG